MSHDGGPGQKSSELVCTTIRELAVRPTKEECHSEDHDLLEREVDDPDELTRRCLAVRQFMNKRLPQP